MNKNRNVALALCALCFLGSQAQVIDVKTTEELSPYVFGHNLEHTRSAVNGGLSAQMLKNRKFAAKPQPMRGTPMRWFPIGERTLMLQWTPYTKHICLNAMRRQNELNSLMVQNPMAGQQAGIGQYDLAVVGGKPYELRTVTRVSAPVKLHVALTDRSGRQVYAFHTLALEPGQEWAVDTFYLTPSAGDNDAAIRYYFSEQAEVTFGALSLMPKDNFHGLRSDVVALLKRMHPRLIRWPGGNFAGEYRWKDGLLPVDQRGPQQSYREIETHPHSNGYDYHEIGTDEFIALCREVGAEPMLTINLAWNTPEESAQWVEYCNGSAETEYGRMRAEHGHKEPYNVRFWSLGNEMGYGHMEGPNTPERYTEYARKQADAMLKVTPGLKLFASGPYPNDKWAEASAAALADKVDYISLHQYVGPRGSYHFTTPEETRRTYEATVACVQSNKAHAERMRKCLDATGKKQHISFDEWNVWYAWNRPSCVGEGIYTARMLHFLINYSHALDIPVACYFQPVQEGAIIVNRTDSRFTANGQMFAAMSAHQDGRVCRVTENDDFSTAATLKDGVLTVSMINESYDRPRDFNFNIKGRVLEATLYSSDDVLPMSYFHDAPLDVKSGRGHVTTTLPPHSVAVMLVQLRR